MKSYEHRHLGRRLQFHTHPKYGGNVPIYLDGSGTFAAVIGDVILKADTKHELIRLTNEALKNQTNLEWTPVIEIEFGYNWRSSQSRDEARNNKKSEVNFEFERFWIAQKIDQRWIEAHWDVETYPDIGKRKVEVGDRLQRSRQFRIGGKYCRETGRDEDLVEFKLPYTDREDNEDRTPRYYVPYTEELWVTLQSISERLEQLQNRIIKILKTPESRAQLIANISKLLPAPQEETKKQRRR